MAMSKGGTGLFIVILLMIISFPERTSCDAVGELECLKVPSSVFLTSLRSTIEQVRTVASVVMGFVNGFENDFRVANAVNDCLDLLDFSADELSWTISATENPYGTAGHQGSNLKAWLSAALGNQDTCMEGFDGTNSFVKTIVAGNIGQITSLVAQVLGMVSQTTTPHSFVTVGGGGVSNHDRHQFPSWMKKRDRGMLLQKHQQGDGNGTIPHVVVALDGSGNYTSVMDAVSAAPDKSKSRYIIYVKRGVYKEYVEVKKSKRNLMIVGDGMNVTVITGNRSNGGNYTTYRSATFAVSGVGFIARDITFENTAGPSNHQAVAFRSDSDLSVYYRCGFHGYQDTLYAHSLRQFYRECNISGTVDFMFGNAAAVFQKCQITARNPLPTQKNTITAQGRSFHNMTTGFSIQFSNISAAPDLNTSATSTYLGRPWKEFSNTVFMENYMSDVIRPEGWLEWQGEFALDTLYYGEYMNTGPGAGIAKRVKWPGYHLINNSAVVNNFTVAQLIDGDMWLPSTGITYTSGLAV